jgi:hypothetical protein
MASIANGHGAPSPSDDFEQHSFYHRPTPAPRQNPMLVPRSKLGSSHRHWSPHGPTSSTSREQPFSMVHNTKASTMDGDKKRLFLERMRSSPFVTSNKPPKTPNQNKSTGVEILTDDEVGTVSSEDPHGHMSLFLHHQHEQQVQHLGGLQHQQQQKRQHGPVSFDLNKNSGASGSSSYGFRSLSSDASNSRNAVLIKNHAGGLFGGEDDPPLLMSSIDGVTSQVITTET